MTANHFSNCDESEVRSDAYGHMYCALCGCIVRHAHPDTSNICATLESTTEVDRRRANDPVRDRNPMEVPMSENSTRGLPAPVNTVER